MNYTVLWTAAAEAELATLWLESSNRAAVTRASHEIDQALRRNPEEQGESRDDDTRILLVAPLGVRFRVYPDDRIVRVAHVWIYRVS